MKDHGREHCGLIGVWNHPHAVDKTYLGLYALQHRGEEAAGMVVSDGREFTVWKDLGLVGDVFSPEALARLRGRHAIGHTRYSTTGSSVVANVHPLVGRFGADGEVAVAHNGNLTNALQLRAALARQGAIFQSTTDSEVVLLLLARARGRGLADRLRTVLGQVRGAFALLVLAPDSLVAVRDPQGFRPLSIGRIGRSTVFASETCALDQMGARHVRDVEPGEMVVVTSRGMRSSRIPSISGRELPAHCVFEHVYFARPDSVLYGEPVHLVRERMGEALAREHPVDADCVIAVPDSGNSAAVGYSRASGLPIEIGFIRNHYVGRTFIQPRSAARGQKVEIKLNVVREVVRGKRLVVVDDSIVRGTTARARVRYLREAGAKEIHLRITFPPVKYPCFYGIDFPTSKELIAARLSVARIRSSLGLDSLGYLSVDGMLSAVGRPPSHFCAACVTGRYPVPVEAAMRKEAVEAR
ncbi:MAG: amidophosphoribosyltransferase [Planctomycetes bacterium]|nr:amidophosphoribosyltransferase [Planctomycetota bacterium]